MIRPRIRPGGRRSAAAFRLGVLGLLAFAPVALPGQSAAPPAGQGVGAVPPVVVRMVVTGLTCPFCAYGLEKKIRQKFKEVTEIEISGEDGTVTLRFPEGALVEEKAVRDAVRNAGFRVKEFVEAPWLSDSGRGPDGAG